MNCVNGRSGSSTSSPSRSQDMAVFETSYVEYLRSARTSVQNCINACRAWSAPYDGEKPTLKSFSDSRHVTSVSHDENAASDGEKDGIVSSPDIEEVVTNALDPRAVVSPSSDASCPPSSTVDDGITHAKVIPALSASSEANSLSTESVIDNAGISLAAVSSTGTNGQQQCSESVVLISSLSSQDAAQHDASNQDAAEPSSSNQDTAQPGAPPGHLSIGSSTSDDLESFFRQLSHVSSKSDSDDPAATVDVLTELDEVIAQLDTSSSSAEDFDSQKTLTPEDPPVVSEDFAGHSRNDADAVVSQDSAAAAVSLERTDDAQTSDDGLNSEAQEGRMLASAAGDDEDEDTVAAADDDDDVVHCSQIRPFSALLRCKYEPPYLPTVGTFASVVLLT